MRRYNIEEYRFCVSFIESLAFIENQSLEIQELSRQLELLAGRLDTIEIQQKQTHEHELRLQTSEIRRGQHLRTDNPPQRIETINKRTNCHLNTKNRFKVLKDELENTINSTEEQTIQTSNERNPHQIHSYTQPAGILEPFCNLNKSTNKKMRNSTGTARTTNEKTKIKKKLHVFLIGDSIIQRQKTKFKQGVEDRKILGRP
ncbi:hypothetical protein FHG87_017978 [Trinorchestia longiramus]|nr:hypothetical protein FHG87_017978 [Trinorchestia longiramus]